MPMCMLQLFTLTPMQMTKLKKQKKKLSAKPAKLLFHLKKANPTSPMRMSEAAADLQLQAAKLFSVSAKIFFLSFPLRISSDSGSSIQRSTARRMGLAPNSG